MPGKKAYSDPHMKGFTVHVEVLQQTQHIFNSFMTFSALQREAGSFYSPSGGH